MNDFNSFNEYVFCELLGMSKKEVTRLMEEKVVFYQVAQYDSRIIIVPV